MTSSQYTFCTPRIGILAVHFVRFAAPAIRNNRTKQIAATVFALLLYLCISLAFFGTKKSWESNYFGLGQDPICFMWFLNWWPFALAHGLNPFVTHYVWYPEGFNLTWSTSIPFLALLSAPVTKLFGPVFSFNLLTIAAPALGAWTAFLLARELTGKYLPSLAGGYFFGFSSYELGQLYGHLNLDMIFLVPLAVLLCVKRYHGKLGRMGFIIGLAAVLLAQLGTSTEILAMLCFFAAIAWTLFLFYASQEDRASLWNLALDISYTSIFVVLLASPFLYYMVKGIPELPNEINSIGFFSTEPLNYFIPNVVTRMGSRAFASVYTHFFGGGCEQEAYLGLPLICILISYFNAHCKQPYTKALYTILCVVILSSLGLHLNIAGYGTRIKLPWLLTRNLPLIKHALPTRFTLYVTLCASIVSALWLNEATHNRQRFWRYSLVCLAIVFLAPNPKALTWTAWPQEAFFTPQHVKEALGTHANVLVLPFSNEGPAMSAQINSAMGFTQSGGYVGITPESQMRLSIIESLRLGKPDANFAIGFTAYCASHAINFILLTTGTQPALASAISALHWPQHNDRGVNVIEVPAL